jgi:hypothetical protein
VVDVLIVVPNRRPALDELPNARLRTEVEAGFSRQASGGALGWFGSWQEVQRDHPSRTQGSSALPHLLVWFFLPALVTFHSIDFHDFSSQQPARNSSACDAVISILPNKNYAHERN